MELFFSPMGEISRSCVVATETESFQSLGLVLRCIEMVTMKCDVKKSALKIAGKHKPWTISVPKALLWRLARRIRALGMTRSEYLRHLIRQDYQKARAPGANGW